MFMRKMALLLMSTILVFSLCSVFATDEAPVTISATDEVITSGEVNSEEATITAEESEAIVNNEAIVSGDEKNIDEIISGDEINTVENTDSATTTQSSTETKDESKSNSSDNGSIVGAIIAVVIVVAVVAIAAILRKD